MVSNSSSFIFQKHYAIGKIVTASSAISEEYFKDLKKFIFNNGRNLKVDKYLAIHLNVLIATVNLIAAKKHFESDNERTGETPSVSSGSTSGENSASIIAMNISNLW